MSLGSIRSKLPRNALSWLVWCTLTFAAALALSQNMTSKDASKELFLPGKTTHGHYQIELSCDACHSEGFADTDDFQRSCISCHGEELERADDSHPKSKFSNPRHAEKTKQLDARYCVTCHSEHQPERTGSMGLSLPPDYCFHCHQDVADERPSHQGLSFDSCGTKGCHNFHDNRALYEDFLLKHAQEPPLKVDPLQVRSKHKACPSRQSKSLDSETELSSCKNCHERESTSWSSGRHGMRLAQGLSPMTPKQARLPMKRATEHQQLACSSCHAPGEQNYRQTAVKSCLSCHNDEHSRSFDSSAHHKLLEAEEAGRVAIGSGVSCATCHMPWTKDSDSGELWVQHNQNDNLRPNEKMIRSVCIDCHGVPFALDALADPALIRNNFQGQPSAHVLSVDFVLAREAGN